MVGMLDASRHSFTHDLNRHSGDGFEDVLYVLSQPFDSRKSCYKQKKKKKSVKDEQKEEAPGRRKSSPMPMPIEYKKQPVFLPLRSPPSYPIVRWIARLLNHPNGQLVQRFVPMYVLPPRDHASSLSVPSYRDLRSPAYLVEGALPSDLGVALCPGLTIAGGTFSSA